MSIEPISDEDRRSLVAHTHNIANESMWFIKQATLELDSRLTAAEAEVARLRDLVIRLRDVFGDEFSDMLHATIAAALSAPPGAPKGEVRP